VALPGAGVLCAEANRLRMAGLARPGWEKPVLYTKLVPDNVRNKSGALTLPAHAGAPKDGGKLAGSVARRLQMMIASRGFPVGQVIGTEPGLMLELGVSRAVFREAVRLLEQDEVAQMRRGPGGGLVVTAPRASSVARAAALHLQFFGAGADDIFEARTALELQTADLAAQRIDEKGIDMLRAALEEEAELQDEGGHLGSSHIHLIIAELTGNPALSLFVAVMARLTPGIPPADPAAAAARQADVRHAHERIVEAIVAGDSSLARHRMLRHLQGIGSYLQEIERSPAPPEAE
jgi:DNA-binding FadR family transcriptional regulator